jgi:S1-C subfamily serine protease
MRYSRIALLVLLFVIGFYFLTTHRRPDTAGAAQEAARLEPIELQKSTGPVQLDADEQTNIKIYRTVLPSVVNISSTTVAYDFFYGAVPEEGQGSGFILDREGHILTNNHVIQNARRLEVTLWNRKRYRAQVIGASPSHDIAIIKIDAPELTPAVLGNSSDLVVGQKVYAIGNPFGLHGTLTNGIISSLRSVRGPRGILVDEVIQTDAAINPGNSGGPLLNSKGEVIGINTFILSATGQSAGIGFAIPINVAKAVLDDLVTFGRVRRPQLGIRSLPVSRELAAELGLPSESGLLIVQVVPGSAADRAGLRGGSERALLGNIPILLGGDLIVEVDGTEITDQQDLARVMNRHRAGDKVRVTFYRGSRRMTVDVTLDEARDERVPS